MKQKQSKRGIFDQMIASMRQALGALPDERTGDNSRYTMMDAGASAFSVFFTQEPSFLSFQRRMQERYAISNARTLFGVEAIPSDTQIRRLLDPVVPWALYPVFADCVSLLTTRGYLDAFRVGLGKNDLLVTLDGTEYFSSEDISCSTCSTKKKGGITTYSHGMVNPVIAAPGIPHVIALEPEFIVPQDGDSKQDCENKAAKRWLEKHAARYSALHVTVLGDDLYCHQPLCADLLRRGLNFILVCKPDSHTTLYEWLKGITNEKVVIKWHGKHKEIWTYRFVNGVPIKDGEDALLVNWCELTIMREDGKRLYKNAFVTNHTITEKTIETIVVCGRARWKIENENNNTLKTKGYHLEHNFGHGENHLAALLATMNIIAFLLHSILELMHSTYKLLRERLGRRDALFQSIRTLLIYFCFKSFDGMMTFMIESLKKPYDIEKVTYPM